MRNIKFLFGGLFFVFLLILIIPTTTSAKSAACEEIDSCLVPAPTVLNIEENSELYSNQVVIAGVSWNDTKVDVYIDGVYNGRAVLRTDNSGVGNFYYYPFLELTPGEHTIYTVARNLNEKERSIESRHITFYVKHKPVIKEQEKIDNVALIEENKEETISDPVVEEITTDESSEEVEEKIVEQEIADEQQEVDLGEMIVTTEEENAEFKVAPKEQGNVGVVKKRSNLGAIEGGVSQEAKDKISKLQKTADRDLIIEEFFSDDQSFTKDSLAERQQQNRNIGFAMLVVVIIIIVVWSWLGRSEKSREDIAKLFDKKDNSDKQDKD